MLNACVNVWKRNVFSNESFLLLKNVFVVYRKSVFLSALGRMCVQFTKTLYEKKHVNGLCSRLFNIFFYILPLLFVSLSTVGHFRTGQRRSFANSWNIWTVWRVLRDRIVQRLWCRTTDYSRKVFLNKFREFLASDFSLSFANIFSGKTSTRGKDFSL